MLRKQRTQGSENTFENPEREHSVANVGVASIFCVTWRASRDPGSTKSCCARSTRFRAQGRAGTTDTRPGRGATQSTAFPTAPTPLLPTFLPRDGCPAPRQRATYRGARRRSALRAELHVGQRAQGTPRLRSAVGLRGGRGRLGTQARVVPVRTGSNRHTETQRCGFESEFQGYKPCTRYNSVS